MTIFYIYPSIYSFIYIDERGGGGREREISCDVFNSSKSFNKTELFYLNLQSRALKISRLNRPNLKFSSSYLSVISYVQI